jgi:hypothetical protein
MLFHHFHHVLLLIHLHFHHALHHPHLPLLGFCCEVQLLGLVLCLEEPHFVGRALLFRRIAHELFRRCSKTAAAAAAFAGLGLALRPRGSGLLRRARRPRRAPLALALALALGGRLAPADLA